MLAAAARLLHGGIAPAPPPLAVVRAPDAAALAARGCPPGANVALLPRPPPAPVDMLALADLKATVRGSAGAAGGREGAWWPHADENDDTQVVAVPVADPGPAAAALTAGLAAQPELRAAVAADVELLAAAVAATLGDAPPSVRAKLELVTCQPCPKFHTDSVGCRGLVTYCGAGTFFCDSCGVVRAASPLGPTPAVASVDPACVSQTAAGDLLLLKGAAHADAGGVDGAAHRSPPADAGAGARLVLTVDDVAPAPPPCADGCC